MDPFRVQSPTQSHAGLGSFALAGAATASSSQRAPSMSTTPGSTTASHPRPLTPTGFSAAGLLHEDRVAVANRTREKAWPLIDKRWYPHFHCAAYAGWMSVPGGLCFHAGQYHVFYQHHPYSENWGPMHWGHCVSDDLVHWRHLPVALAPGEPYDSDGCFSGSAVSHGGRLYLFYTGHTWGASTDVDSEGIYQQQCLAVSDDGGVTFQKLGPIVQPPPGYIHFRDPKVWQQDGRWWMVLGAREVAKDVGLLLLYTSDSLEVWDASAYRVVSRTTDKNVFMWECPDFFPVASLTQRRSLTSSSSSGGGDAAVEAPLSSSSMASAAAAPAGRSFCDGVGGAVASSDFVLIYCPQGKVPQGTKYRNRFQSGYLTGHWGGPTPRPAAPHTHNNSSGGSDGAGAGGVPSHHHHNNGHSNSHNHSHNPQQQQQQQRAFEITQRFREFDHGHDFYAPQTFTAPDGRRILIGWLDMWESPMPTKEDGWSGVLTVPRELVYDVRTQRVAMRPIREMVELRVAAAAVPPQVLCDNSQLPLVEDCTAFEVRLTFNLDNSTGEKFGLWLGRGAEIYYDAQTASVVVQRHYPEYMLSGYRAFPLGSSGAVSPLLHLHVFIDRSSVEVFVNDGEAVLSSRVYPADGERALSVFTIGGVAEVADGMVWQLESDAVEH